MATTVEGQSGYAVAFLDWLGCACAGAAQRAPQAMRSLGDDVPARVAFAATAGHVLDYDDTLPDGVAHVSAPCAPAALVLADELDQSLGAMLEAFAEGWEAMAAVVSASHPALYDGGWHPTAVCGPVGAAVVAARLLDLSARQREHAVALALLRAGGTRGAFGTDGKAIQVGLASAAGVQAALLARAGAVVGARAVRGALGFEGVLGAAVPPQVIEGGTDRGRAIDHNWIKLHPSCLGTHAPIDAAAQARDAGYRPDGAPIAVAVHPVARQAAHLDDVEDGLAAKFSIPYCVAHALVHGPPRVDDFAVLDAETRERAAAVSVVVNDVTARVRRRAQQRRPRAGAGCVPAGRARASGVPGGPGGQAVRSHGRSPRRRSRGPRGACGARPRCRGPASRRGCGQRGPALIAD